MKVALVTPYSWTVPGGVNRHIASLANQLRLRGHEVRILAPADGPVEPGVIPLGRTLGVPYNGSIARLAFGPRVAGRVRIALRRSRPDVVHVHEPFAPSASLLALLASTVPSVATFHIAGDSRAYRAARMPLGPLWRKLDGRIAVSAAARDTVEGVFGPGARIVPNGVDADHYAAVPDVDPRTKRVLFFGRLEKRKGPQVLVEAFPAIARSVRDVEVVIAGDGPLSAELFDAVPAPLARSISFTGAFDAPDQLALLSTASLVCLPALGGESFGLTLVEALAAGRPVVASNIPGYAAVARDGVEAMLVPPGDADALAEAVSGLLTDPERIKQMGRAARERARMFDWPRVADEIESVYREVIQRRARAGGGRRRVRRGGATEHD